jgi:hypothetical protein
VRLCTTPAAEAEDANPDGIVDGGEAGTLDANAEAMTAADAAIGQGGGEQ